jgi:hypothetical protein
MITVRLADAVYPSTEAMRVSGYTPWWLMAAFVIETYPADIDVADTLRNEFVLGVRAKVT